MDSRQADSRQALLFDSDHDSHHADDSFAPESSTDTIEMSGLDEIPVTPARRPVYGTASYPDDPQDSDTDSDVEEALLGSQLRTRGRERQERPSTFTQVKRIVLEVSTHPSRHLHRGS